MLVEESPEKIMGYTALQTVQREDGTLRLPRAQSLMGSCLSKSAARQFGGGARMLPAQGRIQL